MATAMIDTGTHHTAAAPADVSGFSGPLQGKWTTTDYAALPANPDLERQQAYEVINGVLYATPLPSAWQQKIVGMLYYHLTAFIRMNNRGKVFVAPYSVELGADVVVQPDVLVVLNDNMGCIVTPNRVIGAPDLTIEVSIPSTTGYDRREKQDAYARAGVREYWVVDAAARTIEVMLLRSGLYRSARICEGKGLIPSRVVQGLPVIAEQFFTEK